ncbi:MAG: hypothetical protein ABSG54_18515 [Terriglobia bacterium]|jgi:hypothetical protein
MGGEPFEVRIPQHFFESLHTGDITPSMFLTVAMLHNWTNWKTGIVRATSAGGMQAWSHKAYSDKTFSEALRRLELMGHITRKMRLGSHHDYPIVLHNYKKCDDAGKVQVINPHTTKTWKEIENPQCDEASDETSYEGSDETSDEGSEKVLSVNESSNESVIESQDESRNMACGGVGGQPPAVMDGFTPGASSGEEIPVEEVPAEETPSAPEIPVEVVVEAEPAAPRSGKSPARRLAQRFWEHQGKPTKYKDPARAAEWTRELQKLIDAHGEAELEAIMDYAFKTDGFWPKFLVRGNDPLKYFAEKLEGDEPGSIREKYERYQARKAAAKARAAANESPKGQSHAENGNSNYPGRKLRGQELEDHNRAVVEEFKRELDERVRSEG